MAQGEGGGAPLGNKNAERGHEAKRALQMALDHYPNIPNVIERMRTLILMWHPVIKRATEESDVSALKEINDRLDGKAPQAVYLSGDEDGGPVRSEIQWVIQPVVPIDKADA